MNILYSRCLATCGSNIINYEVKKSYGTIVVKVTCSENNFVLGCGNIPGIKRQCLGKKINTFNKTKIF
jgi:hypothetical protein